MSINSKCNVDFDKQLCAKVFMFLIGRTVGDAEVRPKIVLAHCVFSSTSVVLVSNSAVLGKLPYSWTNLLVTPTCVVLMRK